MSHFCVFAITETDNEEELQDILQPYHEYECDGVNDEYVKHIDETKDAKETWNERRNDYRDIYEFFSQEYCCDQVFVDVDRTINYEDVRERYAIVSEDGNEVIKYCDFTNPNSKWDYWSIGGRWSTSKDMMKKGDYDYNGWYEKEIKRLTDDWNTYHPLFEKYKFTLVEWNPDAENLDEMRKAYHNQPLMLEIKGNDKKYSIWNFNWDMIKPLEEWLDIKKKSIAPCFAVVNKDGWFERGQMGWWCCVSNEKENWNLDFKKIIDSTPDDHYIWIVDCHI